MKNLIPVNFLLETLRLGLANLLLHKLRSLLTALGIIFGVGAVITMVAIGEGNKQRALADIRELGARNIIVRSEKPAESSSVGQSSQRMLNYGIRRLDVRRIEQTVGGIRRIVPLKQVGSNVTHEQFKANAAIFGTLPELLEVTSLRVERGRYLVADDLERVENVAVLGAQVASLVFPLSDPLENWVRIDGKAFKVVGVLQRVGMAGGAGTAQVGRDLNFDVHIPLTTANANFGDLSIRRSSGSMEATQMELRELYIEAEHESAVRAVADQVALVLDKEHAKTGDVTMIVPLELLEKAERTQRMFNTLMIAIASISLLVGGIGIMNIMLASVTERTREIGIRRALGATRNHIVAQFLVETTVLSGLGGFLGVALGLSGVAFLGFVGRWLPAIESPQVTPWSVIVSLLVATSVGIVFGLYPAVKASQQDPIVALRHD